MLCNVINYNDVISATDSLEFVKDVRFTDGLWKILLSNMLRPQTFGMTLVCLYATALRCVQSDESELNWNTCMLCGKFHCSCIGWTVQTEHTVSTVHFGHFVILLS